MSGRIGPTPQGQIPAGAGGVVGFEDYGGISGGSDYHRSYQTSMLARFAPDTLAKSVRGSWNEPQEQEITPQKPAAVSMIGDDVFATTQFTPTVRNQLHDLRGEAAVNVARGSGADMPQGASEVSWRAYAVENGPASTGLACGSCNAAYGRRSTAQQVSMGTNSPRASAPQYRTPMSKLKAAFYM